jgi:crotonobetainyl-CoA:carnitine CoA-transferase CaiB-like acyl-CoA transferase
VFHDPQVVARGLRVDLPHPTAGTMPQVRVPITMSATPLTPERAPPLLAEHTGVVLRERLGLDAATIATLAAAGVVQIGP